jgi:hypothetical protein
MNGYVWYGNAVLLVMDFHVGHKAFHSAVGLTGNQVAGEISHRGHWVCDVGGWIDGDCYHLEGCGKISDALSCTPAGGYIPLP